MNQWKMSVVSVSEWKGVRLWLLKISTHSHPVSLSLKNICTDLKLCLLFFLSGETGLLLSKVSTISPFFGYAGGKHLTEKKLMRNVFVKGDAYFITGDLMAEDYEGFICFRDRVGDTFRYSLTCLRCLNHRYKLCTGTFKESTPCDDVQSVGLIAWLFIAESLRYKKDNVKKRAKVTTSLPVSPLWHNTISHSTFSFVLWGPKAWHHSPLPLSFEGFVGFTFHFLRQICIYYGSCYYMVKSPSC